MIVFYSVSRFFKCDFRFSVSAGGSRCGHCASLALCCSRVCEGRRTLLFPRRGSRGFSRRLQDGGGRQFLPCWAPAASLARRGVSLQCSCPFPVSYLPSTLRAFPPPQLLGRAGSIGTAPSAAVEAEDWQVLRASGAVRPCAGAGAGHHASATSERRRVPVTVSGGDTRGRKAFGNAWSEFAVGEKAHCYIYI